MTLQAEVVNDIDRFVLSRLEAKGLGFSDRVAKDLLLRRVTYDLTGLPPTLEERAAFLVDTDANAYEKVVDRLLASPRFGEHWAQFWLDLVRYADTDGYALNGARPGVWRYRDYVIDAFNHDKPYDRFVMEQLAVDEMSVMWASGESRPRWPFAASDRFAPIPATRIWTATGRSS